MRRLLSILLVALFGLAPAAALLPAVEEAQLPACCRRHGAHHCMMAAAARQAADGTHRVSAPAQCPLYRATAQSTTSAFALAAAPAIAHERQRHAAVATAQAARTQQARACADRGPPANARLG